MPNSKLSHTLKNSPGHLSERTAPCLWFPPLPFSVTNTWKKFLLLVSNLSPLCHANTSKDEWKWQPVIFYSLSLFVFANKRMALTNWKRGPSGARMPEEDHISSVRQPGSSKERAILPIIVMKPSWWSISIMEMVPGMNLGEGESGILILGKNDDFWFFGLRPFSGSDFKPCNRISCWWGWLG